MSKATDGKRDIFISIKAPHMKNILSRAKTHEFRNYLLLRSVQRMWLYLTSPDQTLRYIAEISQGQLPGDIDDAGLGNADFNNTPTETTTSYAYEILHLYRLRDPLHISALSEQYGMSPPQKYVYIPDELLDAVRLEDQEMLF